MTYHKTTVPIEAWQRVLRHDTSLPPPVLSKTSACYIADIDTARAVLSSLERHAGDPDIDRAILRVRLPLEARLPTSERQHDDG